MYCTTTQPISYVIMMTLLTTTTYASIACPSQCQCSVYSVECIDKGLRKIPKGLPLTIRQINLSDNPHIEIPSHYFLQFKHLFIINIQNCGQRGPLYLPNNVRNLWLGHNYFTVDALRGMLSNKVRLLKQISLENNHLQPLDVKKVLQFLPMNVKMVNLNFNEVERLTADEMKRFEKLRILHAYGCSLTVIEPNTFDTMRDLSKLEFRSNKLSHLPHNLFKFNLRLSKLDFSINNLSEFNSTKLGLTGVKELKVEANRLATFDIRNLQPRTVALNHNKIQRLESKIFHNNPFVVTLSLSNNNIEVISSTAFNSIQRLDHLFLNNNSLKSLPKHLFKGMMIGSIFLRKNDLSSFKDVFDGIINRHVTLLITENKVTSLEGRDFSDLSREAKLYLTCNKIRKMTDLAEIKAKINCFPHAGLTIATVRYGDFSGKGYQCKLLKGPVRYECSACKKGYYNLLLDGHVGYQGSCVKCPPGSYYQDEIASTKCKVCRPGQFVPPESSPGTSASDCQTCPEGTNTETEAGTRACKCLYGYSRRYRFGPCRKCTDKGFNCSLDYQVLRSGFWMTWEGVKPAYTIKVEHQNVTRNACEYGFKSFMKNLDIIDDTYDRRAMHFNCQMPLPIKCPMSKSCIGGIESNCSSEYTGVLCAVCKRGYTRHFNQCVQCPERAWVVMQFISCLALFVTFCCIISLTEKVSAEYAERFDHRTVADIMLSCLKIVIGFYQVLISIIHALSNVHWPENLMTAINILQYIQFQIIQLPSLRCINSEWNISAKDELWIVLVSIITIPLFAVVYYLSKSLNIQYQCISTSEAKRKRFIFGRNCIKFVALFLFVTYTLISTKIMEVLPISCHSFCTANHNNTCIHSMSFLRSDYSIPCPTLVRNNVTLIASYACLIIPFGMPVLLCLLLNWYAPRQRKRKIVLNNYVIERQNEDSDEGWSNHEIDMSSISDDPQFGDSNLAMMTSALKFTYENYHSHYWYWEVIEMIRKLLMTIGIVLFVGHTKIGLTCTLILAMVFTILHAIHKPFKSRFESGAQFFSLIVIPLNLAFGAVVEWQEKIHPSIISQKWDSLLLDGFIAAMDSCLIVVVLARIGGIIAVKLISRIRKSQQMMLHRRYNLQ